MDTSEFTTLDEIGEDEASKVKFNVIESRPKFSSAAEEIDYLNKVLKGLEKNNSDNCDNSISVTPSSNTSNTSEIFDDSKNISEIKDGISLKIINNCSDNTVKHSIDEKSSSFHHDDNNDVPSPSKTPISHDFTNIAISEPANILACVSDLLTELNSNPIVEIVKQNNSTSDSANVQYCNPVHNNAELCPPKQSHLSNESENLNPNEYNLVSESHIDLEEHQECLLDSDPFATCQGEFNHVGTFPVHLSEIKSEPLDADLTSLEAYFDDPAEECNLADFSTIKEEFMSSIPESSLTGNCFQNGESTYIEDSFDNSLIKTEMFSTNDTRFHQPITHFKINNDIFYSKEELDAAMLMSTNTLSRLMHMDMFADHRKNFPKLKLCRLEDAEYFISAFHSADIDILIPFFNLYGSNIYKWKKIFKIRRNYARKKSYKKSKKSIDMKLPININNRDIKSFKKKYKAYYQKLVATPSPASDTDFDGFHVKVNKSEDSKNKILSRLDFDSDSDSEDGFKIDVTKCLNLISSPLKHLEELQCISSPSEKKCFPNVSQHINIGKVYQLGAESMESTKNVLTEEQCGSCHVKLYDLRKEIRIYEKEIKLKSSSGASSLVDHKLVYPKNLLSQKIHLSGYLGSQEKSSKYKKAEKLGISEGKSHNKKMATLECGKNNETVALYKMEKGFHSEKKLKLKDFYIQSGNNTSAVAEHKIKKSKEIEIKKHKSRSRLHAGNTFETKSNVDAKSKSIGTHEKCNHHKKKIVRKDSSEAKSHSKVIIVPSLCINSHKPSIDLHKTGKSIHKGDKLKVNEVQSHNMKKSYPIDEGHVKKSKELKFKKHKAKSRLNDEETCSSKFDIQEKTEPIDTNDNQHDATNPCDKIDSKEEDSKLIGLKKKNSYPIDSRDKKSNQSDSHQKNKQVNHHHKKMDEGKKSTDSREQKDDPIDFHDDKGNQIDSCDKINTQIRTEKKISTSVDFLEKESNPTITKELPLVNIYDNLVESTNAASVKEEENIEGKSEMKEIKSPDCICTEKSKATQSKHSPCKSCAISLKNIIYDSKYRKLVKKQLSHVMKVSTSRHTHKEKETVNKCGEKEHQSPALPVQPVPTTLRDDCKKSKHQEHLKKAMTISKYIQKSTIDKGPKVHDKHRPTEKSMSQKDTKDVPVRNLSQMKEATLKSNFRIPKKQTPSSRIHSSVSLLEKKQKSNFSYVPTYRNESNRSTQNNDFRSFNIGEKFKLKSKSYEGNDRRGNQFTEMRQMSDDKPKPYPKPFEKNVTTNQDSPRFPTISIPLLTNNVNSIDKNSPNVRMTSLGLKSWLNQNNPYLSSTNADTESKSTVQEVAGTIQNMMQSYNIGEQAKSPENVDCLSIGDHSSVGSHLNLGKIIPQPTDTSKMVPHTRETCTNVPHTRDTFTDMKVPHARDTSADMKVSHARDASIDMKVPQGRDTSTDVKVPHTRDEIRALVFLMSKREKYKMYSKYKSRYLESTKKYVKLPETVENTSIRFEAYREMKKNKKLYYDLKIYLTEEKEDSIFKPGTDNDTHHLSEPPPTPFDTPHSLVKIDDKKCLKEGLVKDNNAPYSPTGSVCDDIDTEAYSPSAPINNNEHEDNMICDMIPISANNKNDASSPIIKHQLTHDLLPIISDKCKIVTSILPGERTVDKTSASTVEGSSNLHEILTRKEIIKKSSNTQISTCTDLKGTDKAIDSEIFTCTETGVYEVTNSEISTADTDRKAQGSEIFTCAGSDSKDDIINSEIFTCAGSDSKDDIINSEIFTCAESDRNDEASKSNVSICNESDVEGIPYSPSAPHFSPNVSNGNASSLELQHSRPPSVVSNGSDFDRCSLSSMSINSGIDISINQSFLSTGNTFMGQVDISGIIDKSSAITSPEELDTARPESVDNDNSSILDKLLNESILLPPPPLPTLTVIESLKNVKIMEQTPIEFDNDDVDFLEEIATEFENDAKIMEEIASEFDNDIEFIEHTATPFDKDVAFMEQFGIEREDFSSSYESKARSKRSDRKQISSLFDDLCNEWTKKDISNENAFSQTHANCSPLISSEEALSKFEKEIELLLEETTYYDTEPLAQLLIDKAKGFPLVGLQYILEVQKATKNLDQCSFICSLCSKKMSSDTLVAHVKSVPHRLKYASFHVLDLHSTYGSLELKQWTAALVKEFTAALQKLEAVYGRQQMGVCSETAVPSAITYMKNKAAEELAKLKTENRNKSEKAVDISSVVASIMEIPKKNVKDIEKLLPSRETKENNPESTTIDISQSPIKKFDKRSQSDKSPKRLLRNRTRSPSSKPRQRSPANRKRSRSPVRARSPWGDRRYSRHSKLSRSPIPVTRSRSPISRRSRSPVRQKRSRSPFSRNANRSPFQRRQSPPRRRSRSPQDSFGREHSPIAYKKDRSPLSKRASSPGWSHSPAVGRSTSPAYGRPISPRHSKRTRSPASSRNNFERMKKARSARSPELHDDPSRISVEDMKKIRDFKADENELKLDNFVRFEKYLSDPETHRKYKMEWNVFWENRIHTLRKEGVSPSSYNITSEWTEYWRKRLTELCEYDFNERQRKLLLRYNFDKRMMIFLQDNKGVDELMIKCNDKDSPEYDRTERTKRSSSPWEEPVAVHEKPVYEAEFTVYGTLKLLSELDDQLGSLGDSIGLLFNQTKDLLNKSQNPVTMFDDKDNRVLLKLSIGKLSSLVASGVLDAMSQAKTHMAIEHCNWLQKEIEKAFPELPSFIAGLNIATIAQSTLGMGHVQVAAYIAKQLMHIGNTNATESDLNYILKAVYANHSKINADNILKETICTTTQSPFNPSNQSQGNGFEIRPALFPSGTDNQHPIKSPETKIEAPADSPEQHQKQDDESSGALSLLQSSYEDNIRTMDELSLEELQERLMNFSTLTSNEQQELTDHLKKLEATDSKRVTKLRTMMRQSAKPAKRTVKSSLTSSVTHKNVEAQPSKVFNSGDSTDPNRDNSNIKPKTLQMTYNPPPTSNEANPPVSYATRPPNDIVINKQEMDSQPPGYLHGDQYHEDLSEKERCEYQNNGESLMTADNTRFHSREEYSPSMSEMMPKPGVPQGPGYRPYSTDPRPSLQFSGMQPRPGAPRGQIRPRGSWPMPNTQGQLRPRSAWPMRDTEVQNRPRGEWPTQGLRGQRPRGSYAPRQRAPFAVGTPNQQRFPPARGRFEAPRRQYGRFGRPPYMGR